MSEFYRDRTDGAMARRQDLLRKRRDELVTMPHTIRRVVVARAARAAAASAAIACGAVTIAFALSPKLASFVASGLPGINPAVISTGVGAAWVLALVAFAISRGRSEHRFAVAMSTYVLPGDDLDHDIERLSHERPDAVAREMAQRLEVASAALPVAAAALVVPATLVYIAHAIHVGGWPSTAEYEFNLALCAKPMLYVGIAGVFAALVMTRRNARLVSVVPFAASGSLLMGASAAKLLTMGSVGATWVTSAASVILGTIAFVNWSLGVERKAIAANDPTAGSELFTLRGLVLSVRKGVENVGRRVSAPMAIGLVAFVTLLVCAGSPISTTKRSAAAAVSPRPTVLSSQPRPVIVQTPGNSSYQISATSDGRIRIDARFVDGKPLQLEGLGGIAELPDGWNARVTVSVAPDSPEVLGSIAVNPYLRSSNNAPLHLGAGATEHRFTLSACNGPIDLGLSMVPVDTTPGVQEVSFLIEPALELAHCNQ